MLAKIKITPKQGILDPQGAASQKALLSLGFTDIADVRVGKYIELKINASDKGKASEVVEDMCNKLFANTVIENYTYSIEE